MRRGMTLVELLAAMAILALLAALLLPSLRRVRELSRSASCKNNLRQIGLGLASRGSSDRQGRLCSGAFDYRRDGCIDRWGWVADLRQGGYLVAENSRCPSNALRVSEKVNDLYGISTTDNLDNLVGHERARWDDGICGAASWRGDSGSGGPGFASTSALTAERAQLIARYFLGRGYNTTYASSWFLVRTAPRVRIGVGRTLRTNGQAAQQGLKGRRGTLGPLTLRYLGNADRPASIVPLLADAAPGDPDEALAATGFSTAPTDLFAQGESGRREFAARGELLAESVSDGPSYYHPLSQRIKRIGSYNSRLDVQLQCELRGDCRPPTGGSGGNLMYLQSTLSWLAVHGGSQRSLNLLMADGSVQEFSDRNHDGYLNPGFPVPEGLGNAQYRRLGYRNATIELPEARCFSGVFLNPNVVQGDSSS